MKKKYIILLICILSLILTACTDSSDIKTIGEHTDTYSSIYVEPSIIVDEQDYGKDDTGTYKENDDGSLDIDMSQIEENEDVQMAEPGKTQFELNQELNGDNTSPDTEEVNDKFGLIAQGITVTSVINEITKISDRDNFGSVEIVHNPEGTEILGGTMDYIVRFDTYDYYIITYYIGEGCVSHHDDSGYLASVYGEHIEDEEWFDEE